MRQIHQWLARLVLAGLLVQFYLAGTGIFGVGTLDPHRMLGSVLAIPIILLLILALAGRLGQRLIGLSVLLVVLTIVQAMLPSLRDDAAWLAALHPVNALALMGITAAIGREAAQPAVQGAVQ